VTVKGCPVVLWNTNALPVKSKVPELIPVPFISIGISTNSRKWEMAIVLLPGRTA
jgi:hypothetical protein